MLSELLAMLAVLTLFCLYGTGDRIGPRDAYDEQNDEVLDNW